MKIAYIYDAVYPWLKGGAEKRVYEISKRLAERGHEVHWFGLKWWDGENDIVKDGVYLHGIGKWDNLYADGRRSIKEGLHFGIKTLTGLKGDFDIIDCQEFPYFPCFTAKVHSLFKGTPLVITWYETWDDYWFEYLGKKGVFGWAVERFAAKLPKLMIPISEKIKVDLKKLGVPEKKMRVVPNGVDFYTLQKAEPVDKRFDVIYVGRLASHKNVNVLLRAISIARKKVRGVKCAIIGDGPEMRRLKALSDEMGLNDNVEFFGFVESDEEVYAYMRASKLLMLPSTREGFPNTILEANSCELPVVIVRHEKNAGVALVKDGYNGFVLNLSPEEIAEKVVYLLQNENELNELRKSAVEFARDYDWSVILRRIEEVYEEALK
ncbi:glycosyltransferase family 4 protein [Dehalococcoidia bacterium]|nr:glycosyltransferase family 4 protein [Dehalococcoidia bacterium]